MIRSIIRRGAALAVASFACMLITTPPASAADGGGAVYTLSNETTGNRVVVFDRAADGSLTAAGAVPTGGLGNGGGLGSQGSVVVSDDGRWLLAVNPGSDDISVFRIGGELVRTSIRSSGGDLPISVTVHGSLVYVLNDGSDDLVGFRLSPTGKLLPIHGSRVPLSGAAPSIAPAQVEFTPDGGSIVVTEKDTNLIDVYRVQPNRRLSAPDPQPSEGATPFGFAFDPQGRLVVSEASGGAAGASALSSYSVGAGGTLATISASVADTQSAACWVAVTSDGRFAYTTNTGSATVSSYAIASGGSLSLEAPVAGVTGAAPIDMGISPGDAFLYTLNAGADTLSAFSIGADGSLMPTAGVTGLPASTVGLAVT